MHIISLHIWYLVYTLFLIFAIKYFVSSSKFRKYWFEPNYWTRIAPGRISFWGSGPFFWSLRWSSKSIGISHINRRTKGNKYLGCTVTVHYSKLFRLFGAILMWVSCNNIFFLFHIIRDSVSIPVILSSTLRSLELMLTKLMTK